MMAANSIAMLRSCAIMGIMSTRRIMMMRLYRCVCTTSKSSILASESSLILPLSPLLLVVLIGHAVVKSNYDATCPEHARARTGGLQVRALISSRWDNLSPGHTCFAPLGHPCHLCSGGFVGDTA